MGFARQEYWSGVPLPSPVRMSNMLINMYRILYSTNVEHTFSCARVTFTEIDHMLSPKASVDNFQTI